jgi:hypothetical protein
MSATISRTARTWAPVSSKGPERRRQLAPVDERDTVALLPCQLVGSAVENVNEQQLLECQPAPPVHRLGDGVRAVHHPQRLTERRHTGACQQLRG